MASVENMLLFRQVQKARGAGRRQTQVWTGHAAAQSAVPAAGHPDLLLVRGNLSLPCLHFGLWQDLETHCAHSHYLVFYPGLLLLIWSNSWALKGPWLHGWSIQNQVERGVYTITASHM